MADFGVDGFRYHFLRDPRSAPTATSRYEAMVARYNADLANNLGNLLSRVATVVGRKCGGDRAGAARPTARSPRSPPSVYADAAAAWAAVQPSVALEATWRLIRETNAYLEANEPWKAEPGPAVDAVLGDALEVLRIVGRPRRRRRCRKRRRPSGGASGCSGHGRRPAAAGGGGLGRLPGRPARSRRARRCSPARPDDER